LSRETLFAAASVERRRKSESILTVGWNTADDFHSNVNQRRVMKRYISYAVIALLATIAVSNAAPPDKAAMEGKEKAAWQAFKDRNEAEFKKLIDKDFRGVYDGGIANIQKELDDMKKWDMKSFELSGYDMFSDEKDVVVATYTVKIEGTYDGKDMSGTYNAGSVWKQENGKWMAIFHTNVKQAASQ
jgi:hypothetical protein